MSAAYFGINAFNSETPRSGDSTKVIRLNNEAFNLRLINPEKTVEIADSALKIAHKINYMPGVAEAHRVAGIGYGYSINTKLSIKNYIEALKYFRQLQDAIKVAKIYNNIGNLYTKVHDQITALSYFKKALALSENIQDKDLKTSLYLNIATVHQRLKEYDTALMYFDKSFQLLKNKKDTLHTLLYLQNTGVVYYELNQLDEAKTRLLKAIDGAKKHEYNQIITGCLLTLSKVYMKTQDFESADWSIKEGLKYSRIQKDIKTEYDFIHTAYEFERKRSNYRRALDHLLTVYQHDSLQLSRYQSDNIGINSQHYIQLRKIQEKELIITKQQFREATFRWIITLIVLAVLAATIVILVLYLLRAKKRKQAEVVIQNNITALEQKALQAMMNPHFVFNVMNSIQHFINQTDLKTANQILAGFARLARKHLEICMSSTISVQEELVYLQHYLYLEKIRCSDKMEYEITVDEEMDSDEVFIPSMLIQPFIENAIWHGIMPKNEGGLIKIRFELIESDLFISILDNGVGISNSEANRKAGHISRGMTLIRERVRLLNKLNKRHISIKQEQTGLCGTEVLIKIPA